MAGLFLIVPSWYLPFKASQAHVVGLNYEMAGDWDKAHLSFQNALHLNPYDDESALALARIYQRRYQQSGSVMDFSLASLWTEKALSLKKVLSPTSS